MVLFHSKALGERILNGEVSRSLIDGSSIADDNDWNRHGWRIGKVFSKGLAVSEKQKLSSDPLPKHKQRDARLAIEEPVSLEAGAEIKKVVRRGRPPLGDRAKGVVTIRLDADVLESYRGLGAGWQTRINADLRRARKLKKSRPAGEA